jgi:hypothetical protein
MKPIVRIIKKIIPTQTRDNQKEGALLLQVARLELAINPFGRRVEGNLGYGKWKSTADQ